MSWGLPVGGGLGQRARWRWPVALRLGELRVGAAAARGVSAVVALAIGAALTVPSATAQDGPLANPPINLQPPAMSVSSGTCRFMSPPGDGRSPPLWHCSSPCYPHLDFTYNGSAACLSLVMQGVDAAQRSEGLRAFILPSDFTAMSVPEQLLVLVNLERLSRGVPPIAGLSPYLMGPAMTAAREAKDPPFSATYGHVAVWWPASGGMYGFGSTWAGNDVDAAAAVFGWMYDDGWGGSRAKTTNLACTSPGASGCWGHRDVLLGETTGTSCTDCIAGAGFAQVKGPRWASSYTFLLVRPASYPTPLIFSWERDVVPFLPPGWERAP
ncbi:MAG: hypothetical protein ACP5VR_01610 [Acidimicrobiales bacterium]